MTTKDRMLLFSYQTEALAVLEKWKKNMEEKNKNTEDLMRVIRAFDLMYHYQFYVEGKLKEEQEMFSDYREKKNREILEKNDITI